MCRFPIHLAGQLTSTTQLLCLQSFKQDPAGFGFTLVKEAVTKAKTACFIREQIPPAPTKRSVELWACAWDVPQDAVMGVQCNRNAPDHFHFAGNHHKDWCMDMKMNSHLPAGERLVEGPVSLTFLGARPGAKFPGKEPAAGYNAKAINSTVIKVCGYYASPDNWTNSDTMFRVEYRTTGGN